MPKSKKKPGECGCPCKCGQTCDQQGRCPVCHNNGKGCARIPLDRERMPLDIAAKTFSNDGNCTITKAMLEADVKAGAPTNPDGTIGQLGYLAWLLSQGD